jgi:type I restriction-modification system DNA methylase subunit
MNLAQIENNIQELVKNFDKESFIYDLLLAYDHPRASISRLKSGGLNLSKIVGEIAWKKKLFFKVDYENDLHELIDELKDDKNVTKYAPRFIIATDYDTLLAIDTKTDDTLDTPILDLAKHFDFFLPWAGMEKAQLQSENPADVKAAERMAKLYDEIKKDNPTKTKEEVHNLNVFLSRLLFCFFAEDTGIFEAGQFTNAISSHTQQDGSDLHSYLDSLFEVMNTEQSKRHNLPAYLDSFPYVNGGLFRDIRNAPAFTTKSRQALIESGELDWSAINPDIFGSMIQAVISPEHRGSLGMHYTSVPNIMKVIEPLFLDELKEAFEAARGNKKLLNQLLHRISNIKIFDPACGSGNFLIIAYKQLRRLEMEIFKENSSIAFSGIRLSNFYGIEVDDFAHEIAILSLWLAEHQMNKEFFNAFGRTKPPLPLVETGNIVHGNATRLNWDIVCPKTENDEIYILGNPPYKGSSGQTDEQKIDMNFVFDGIDSYKNLDYISAWFIKGAKYIYDFNSKLAFVSTNSICQGEQVALIWPNIFNKLEIGFAYTSFKWSNNAKSNAGVTVVVVSLRNKSEKTIKYLYFDNKKVLASNINAYLADAKNIIVQKRSKPLSVIPEMTYGNKAVYGEPLILSAIERSVVLNLDNSLSKFIRKFVGAKELIDNIERHVIWIKDKEIKEAENNKFIRERIDQVRKLRLSSKEKGAKELALRSHQFRDIFETITNSVIIPLTTSERREYLPLGFCGNDVILSNAVSVIYDSEPWIFSLISSRLHIVWIKAVCGSLETRIRYSTVLGYNTFPFPTISIHQKQGLENHVYQILEEREKYSEKTLAQLYDPEKMPEGLREAHRLNDLAIERCYRSKPFESDEERLEYLFKMYEKMKNDENNNGTLFAKTVKPKKK